MATRKVRYKKLSPKTTLPVLRADQVDPTEYEFLNNDGEIATGVEAGEQSVRVFPLLFLLRDIIESRD